MCCAEWGEACDTINIIYKDKSVQRIIIMPNDLPTISINSFVIGKTRSVLTGDIVQEKAALTKCINRIEYKEIDAIELPKSNNIHIMAITLINYSV